mmetsp:Transcript_28570/g.39317  ORF Transcript_28570/g.39317 Transcript_28570/m.39317 type:complete len:94 (-) Transcript_28570:80-361(-)
MNHTFSLIVSVNADKTDSNDFFGNLVFSFNISSNSTLPITAFFVVISEVVTNLNGAKYFLLMIENFVKNASQVLKENNKSSATIMKLTMSTFF